MLAGNIGHTTVYADEVSEQTELLAAEEKEFDTDYSVTWSNEVKTCWSKVTLEERGILSISATKPYNDLLDYLEIRVKLYDETGKYFMYLVAYGPDEENASLQIGLEKGTYYVEMYPEYPGSFAKNTITDYKFSFQADENCELEPNDTKDDATPMKVDVAYTGYFGAGFTNTSKYGDENDFYKVKLTKGQAYKFTFEEKQGLTIVRLYGKNTEVGKYGMLFDAEKFNVPYGTTFIAPYTGYYYANIYNYSNAQYQYTIKVSNVTPKATSLTSVKAGKGAFTAKWKKSSCSGYQIQYSTNKNFKSPKTVNISAGKTSYSVKKLSSNKKYYVRIRTYRDTDNKKTVYSSWSKAKSVTTK